MVEISYHLADIETLPFQGLEQKYSHWLEKVAIDENVTIQNLTYIFCSDEYLLDINIKYLDHDYYTDIITFPYKEGQEIEADLYISVDRVKENADEFNVDFHNELNRVMVHGFLHLIGYKDKTADDVALMRSKEDLYLSTFDTM
jgi:rRNA maturation RNase YbeY